MSDSILIKEEGHTAILTLNNPPANTWTEESLNYLVSIVEQFNQRNDIMTLIVRSDSEKFFSAGADLNMFAHNNKDDAARVGIAFGNAFEALSSFRGLTIAVINGWSMGGGLEVALACDLRVAEPQATLALPEASVGVLPCAGGTQNLTLLVGEGWAKRMILCGERVKAEKALEIGLVEALAEQGKGMEQAMEWAHGVEKQSPVAVAACKRLIQQTRSAPLSEGLPKEREEFNALFDDPNQLEGVTAFLEKRKPEWTY
ncbi:enoyl-CoA hydratase [Endozoicomonadaceae bacterium StTr2]